MFKNEFAMFKSEKEKLLALLEMAELGEYCARFTEFPEQKIWEYCIDPEKVLYLKAYYGIACLTKVAVDIFPLEVAKTLPGKEVIEAFYKEKGINFNIEEILKKYGFR